MTSTRRDRRPALPARLLTALVDCAGTGTALAAAAVGRGAVEPEGAPSAS